MRDRMRYINHLGETVDFGARNIIINENNFRDYAWNYTNLYGKAANFVRSMTTKKLPVIVFGEDHAATANNIFETLEKDVLAEKNGRMYVGDYYLEGYFYAGSSSDYTGGDRVEITMQFVADGNLWKREHPYKYRLHDEAGNERGLGYSYDYPYDFLSTINTQALNNPSFADADFILTIYGPIENPTVIIGGNEYRVKTFVALNEYITINTSRKTIVRTTAKGVRVNEFSKRELDHYVFKKIAPGINAVSMPTTCDVDIVILEERSEPRWI